MNTESLLEIVDDLEHGGITKELAAKKIRDWVFKSNIWPQTTDEYYPKWPVLLPQDALCSMCGQDTRKITVCMCTTCPRASRISCSTTNSGPNDPSKKIISHGEWVGSRL